MRPGALAQCCRASRGLLVGFLLLRCSVLFAIDLIVFAMSPFWSWFVSSGGLCVGGLGVYRADRGSDCLDPHMG